ncbi:Protein tssc1 [Borealophlyctis nickersoniae]|nr:Protein tssc1 [Borealophlyctis nickersoniae]
MRLWLKAPGKHHASGPPSAFCVSLIPFSSLQARNITAQLGEQDRNRFLVGTVSLKQDNEVDFDEDEFEITAHVYKHPDEVLSIAPCPAQADVLFTCHKEGANKYKATLWKLGALEMDEGGRLKNHNGILEETLVLAPTADLPSINRILWDPSGTTEKVIALGDNSIGVYALEDGFSSAKLVNTFQIPAIPNDARSMKVRTGAWNPHSADLVALGTGCSVRAWDLRTMSAAFVIPNAHTVAIKDVDYNPNKPYNIATGGDDCKIRFWDVRNCDKPLKEISDHTHWVWSVRFNRFHDQLLLSSSSDCQVNLQSIISISSAPLSDDTSDSESENSPPGSTSDDEYGGKPVDGLVAAYDQHEESVYSVAWSNGDPWIFASLSYDGRVVVNMR